MRYVHLLPLAVLAAGCPSEEEASPCVGDDCPAESFIDVCLDEHPNTADYDWDAAGIFAEATIEMCEDDGGDCPALSEIMTLEATRCVAEGHGLAVGIADWEVNLGYSHDDKDVVWMVSNTTWEEGAASGGDGLHLDPVTGAIAYEIGWEATP